MCVCVRARAPGKSQGLEAAWFAPCCSYCARGLNIICYTVNRRRKLKENTFSSLALVAVSIQFVGMSV